MRIRRPQPTLRTILLLCVLWTTAGLATVTAQDSPRLGSEMDLLRNNELVLQLGLSQAQQDALAEAAKGGTPGREVFDPFLQRMKETADEAERTKIREEMKLATVKAKEDANARALKVLDSRQLKLLRSLYIQQAGVRAFSDVRVAAELGISEDQKKVIDELAVQRREASSKLGFETTPEQQEAFRKEWEDKYLAVLNDEQKKRWAEQSASAPSVATAPGANPAMNNPNGPMPADGVAPDAAPPAGAEIVSSFGGASDAANADQLVEKFSFNFRYAPWDQVLQDFAAGAGYTLDLNQVPPGTFSHIDTKEYNAGKALDILNGYLQRKGYALLLKDGFLVCVNVDKGIPPNLIPDVAVDELLKVEQGIHKIGENEVVRIEIPLEKLDVGVMAQEVEQLLGSLGTMTAFTQTGSLIIADTGSNLRRIKSYVDMSVSRRKGDLVFKTYMLKNIDAEEAEFMLLSQFGMRQGVANVSAGASGDRRGPPAPTPTPAPASSGSQLQVMSDVRTNSLFVTASPDQQTLVEEIIKAIDISELPDGTRLTREGNTGPYLRVYRVSGQADQVAQSITAMMPGVVVNEDGRAGTVHIFATARQHEQVEEWVKSFSEGTGASGSVAVIPLAKMDPLTAAATLRNLFIAEGANAPTVETDLYGNRIIVKGTGLQVEQIKQVLTDLGEDGTGLKKKGEGGNIRRYSLRGRDPEEFFKYLEQEWQASEKTSIRIVVPKKSGPIKGIKTPSDKDPASEEEPAAAEKEDSTTQAPARRSGLRTESGYLPVNRVVDEAAVAEPAAASQQAPGTANPPVADRRESTTPDGIQIVVDGDELLLLSRDEDALDRLEETMDFLQQSIPFRTKWTVFYLQAADATEAAALLEQFIPSSSVTNTTSSSSFGLSSMFSPLTQSVSDMTGLSGLGANPQTLRIIPDPRSNSLFVTGPQAAVEEAEGFLEILDSNNIPESLREMQPRRIEVEYAEIDDIATMVNETFKPYMEPAGGRQQQNNPLAQMFGGGSGNGKGNEPQGVQMTVAVDRQTSSLVISSSEALFTKVQEMVKESDEAAKKSNRTIRVVQLKNADASVIQESLRSLFPRVTTSATRSSSSTNNSNSGGNNSGGNNNGQQPQTQQPQTDPFQQMMQDRMRQRGGTNPFGGGTNPFGGGGGFTPFGGGNFGGRGGQFGGRGGR
ncbi:MAG: secretin N-terminal domain-containing protein [Planctomycetaceae bacterium]